ncbi:hypothetical protein O6H91_13G066700 [Diphasiastrum complanatum]|nr:hypothetical protein O6H91_13G066700 [Diphasiastrum complanatum]
MVQSPFNMVWLFVLLGTMVCTNMVALYSLSIARELQRSLSSTSSAWGQLPSDLPASILHELSSIREELRRTQRHLLDNTRSSHNEGVAMEAVFVKQKQEEEGTLLSSELLEFTEDRRLPLGRNPSYGSQTIASSIGHLCYLHKELLNEYMSYTVGDLCPDDWALAQKLMVSGCEPLPRRRCFARAPIQYSKPLPLPVSLWSCPPEDTVRWTHYSCKSFDCLNRRARESKAFADCADCFELTGPERNRWVIPRDRHDFMKIEQILAMKEGTIRIGLDLGGGSGSFAARMFEHNVTIITSTLNLNGPFNEFVALRGLLPLYITISQRLPFFDNALDLVHTMHVLSNWLPQETLEFILYDIDRVLRPGGLFWLDRFFCTEDQFQGIYAPMIEKMGYTKIKWVTGKKLDRNGVKNKEIYLSALLEKPLSREQLPISS